MTYIHSPYVSSIMAQMSYSHRFSNVVETLLDAVGIQMLPVLEAQLYALQPQEVIIAIQTAFETSKDTLNKSSARIGLPITVLRGKNVVLSNPFHNAEAVMLFKIFFAIKSDSGTQQCFDIGSISYICRMASGHFAITPIQYNMSLTALLLNEENRSLKTSLTEMSDVSSLSLRSISDEAVSPHYHCGQICSIVSFMQSILWAINNQIHASRKSTRMLLVNLRPQTLWNPSIALFRSALSHVVCDRRSLL